MSKIANTVSSAPITRGDRDELVRSLVDGERRFHELPKDLSPEEAAEIKSTPGSLAEVLIAALIWAAIAVINVAHSQRKL